MNISFAIADKIRCDASTVESMQGARTLTNASFVYTTSIRNQPYHAITNDPTITTLMTRLGNSTLLLPFTTNTSECGSSSHSLPKSAKYYQHTTLVGGLIASRNPSTPMALTHEQQPSRIFMYGLLNPTPLSSALQTYHLTETTLSQKNSYSATPHPTSYRTFKRFVSLLNHHLK